MLCSLLLFSDTVTKRRCFASNCLFVTTYNLIDQLNFSQYFGSFALHYASIKAGRYLTTKLNNEAITYTLNTIHRKNLQKVDIFRNPSFFRFFWNETRNLRFQHGGTGNWYPRKVFEDFFSGVMHGPWTFGENVDKVVCVLVSCVCNRNPPRCKNSANVHTTHDLSSIALLRVTLYRCSLVVWYLSRNFLVMLNYQ